MKITYFNKREIEKRVRGVILGQKLTLNHPSLMDEGEETKVFVTAHKRERKRREPTLDLIGQINIAYLKCHIYILVTVDYFSKWNEASKRTLLTSISYSLSIQNSTYSKLHTWKQFS